MSKFAHLHMHTEYSVLDGINRVDTLPEYIKDLGQTSVAITDHGNVSGSYRFYKSCKKAGVQPIIGMEAYYTAADKSVKGVDDLGEKYYHMVLLAKNATGLRNLRWLSTKAYTEGMYFKPRIDDLLLADYSEGIYATSSCLGSRISQLILRDRNAEAEKMLLHHAAMFKDNFFIEVQLHAEEEQQKVNAVLLNIAQRHGLPLILTNDCHYTGVNDKHLHEQALCMQTNDVMSNEKRFSFGDIDVHVANHDWMWEQAQKQGIPYEAISNTAAIASTIDSDSYFADTRNRYPEYRHCPPGVPSWLALERVAKERLWAKMNGQVPEAYKDRMNHELSVIKKMGFYDYLLIVWQFLEGARAEDVLVGPGRGSAAGSLVSYALGITQVDPIKYGLVFERWLNYGRAARPLLFDRHMIKSIEELPEPQGHMPCEHHHDHSH